MKSRVIFGLGAAALTAALSACGGTSAAQDTSKSAVTVTETPEPTLQLADACPRIQDALDANLAKVLPKGSDFRGFADDIAVLAEQVDPKGVPLLESLYDASAETARKIDADPFAEDLWFDAMDRVFTTCQQLGAPLK